MFLIPLRIRSRHPRNALLLAALVVSYSAAFAAFTCTATTTDTPATTVPDDVRALVAPTDILLAYKPADLYGDGNQAAVIVIRHQVSGRSDYDFDNNPCELVVLRQKDGKFAETDRSTKAVDCTYNDVARSAPAMSLNDNLTVAPASIVYVNQKDKGDSTFYFAWSKEKSAWYLQRATASNPDRNRVTNVSVSYPGNLMWTPMSSVDPDAIAEILEEQGKTTR